MAKRKARQAKTAPGHACPAAWKDPFLRKAVAGTDKRTAGRWARRCAMRVQKYFRNKYPHDHRPQAALNELARWINGGQFHMAIIRRVALGAHAAARRLGIKNPARSAARSAGQAVATAHAKMHAIATAHYAVQAVFLATGSQASALKELNEQRILICKLKKQSDAR